MHVPWQSSADAATGGAVMRVILESDVLLTYAALVYINYLT